MNPLDLPSYTQKLKDKKNIARLQNQDKGLIGDYKAVTNQPMKMSTAN